MALLVAQSMVEAVRRALREQIATVRADARAAGSDRLRRELAMATGEPIDVASSLSPIDSARADVASQSLSAALASGLLVAVQRTSRGADLRREVALAFDALGPRIARTVATENATAFGAARDEGMGWVAETRADRAWVPLLYKRWDATLDRKTCKVCKDLDGDVKFIGASWDPRPGEVHPHCRCFAALAMLPVPRQVVVTPGRQVDDDNPRDTLR